MFFSFLTLFEKLNFFYNSEDKIKFLALQFSDETLLNFDLIQEKFSIQFANLMKKIQAQKFNFCELAKMKQEIFNIVDQMDKILEKIAFEKINDLPLFKDCKIFLF